MNREFRLAIIRDYESNDAPKIIDYTRYDVPVIEPQYVNVADWSLMNVLNMKRTRLQDAPIPFQKLAPEEQAQIVARYPELGSLAKGIIF